ncbi:MAG: glycosyltransferase [Acidobacteriaceae bacterium]
MNTDHSPEPASVCVLIPMCNEEESLPMLRARLDGLQQRLGLRFRLHYLFVDDGSTDGTSGMLETVVPDGASWEVHTHATNRGVGAAFRTGFAHAAADVVCTIDADCSYGPEQLYRMIEEVESGEADVVVASPYHPEGGVEGVQGWRLLLSTQCSRLYRAVSPLQLHTYTSIFRAYRGSFVRDAQFQSDDFVSAVEILLSASHQGYRVKEMPLTLHRRVAGVSKMRVLRTICGHAALLVNCLLARNGGYPGFCQRQHRKASQQAGAPKTAANACLATTGSIGQEGVLRP